MIMSSGGTTTAAAAAAAARSSRFPFTAAQWQELEHQALVYKYMISGMPIPPDLLFTIKRSLDSSLSPSSKLLLHHQPQHSIGWNCFQMGFGRKIDPEPGRCRRTDGKKWRCSKEAYPDSKYCERHMHRGRNRSRKPVEVVNILSTPPPPQTTTSPPPTAIPLSSMNSKSPNFSSSSSDLHSHHHLSYASSGGHNYNIPYPYSSISSSSSNSRPPGIGGNNLSSQDHFLLDSGNPYSHPDKCYRNRYGHDHGMKDEVDELPFFSETSRNINMKSGSMGVDDSWQLEPLTMTMGCPKQRNLFSPDHIQNGGSYSYLQLQSLGATRQQQQQQQQQDQYYELPYNFKTCDRSDDQPSQKVMHHFFDEWPHTSNNNKDSSTTQLSISIPNSSHDFFSTHNDK